MSPLLITILAVLRRFAVALGAGVLSYLIGVWPETLKKALEADPVTIAWTGTIWLAIELVQKLVREKKKG